MRSPLRIAVAGLAIASTVAAVNPAVHETFRDLMGVRQHIHKEFVASETIAAKFADVPTTIQGPAACVDGFADVFPCDGVDLLSFIPRDAAGMAKNEVDKRQTVLSAKGMSDSWGWVDPTNDVEYAIVGDVKGTVFIRLTDPTDPEILGVLPNRSPLPLTWQDVKVYADHVFIVSESPAHEMQVFDLTQLRDVTGDAPQTFLETAIYPLNTQAHNLAINEATGYGYLLGESVGLAGQTPCSMHIVDLRNPAAPTPAGCYVEKSDNRISGLFVPRYVEYVHDAQCVVYDGPDTEHKGREICFGSNENNVSIIDVTDKLSPRLLGQVDYYAVEYAHQGWLNDDQDYFLFGDELDEDDAPTKVPFTRTMVLDVSDLDDPKVHHAHYADTKSIDHNLYVQDDFVYQSNYTAGLRILDAAALDDRAMTEVAFFDVFPDNDKTIFAGTWNNYPYFPSGTVMISGYDGVWFVKVQAEALDRDPTT